MIALALFCSGFSIGHNRLSDHPEMIDDNGKPIQTDLYSVRFVVDEEDDD